MKNAYLYLYETQSHVDFALEAWEGLGRSLCEFKRAASEHVSRTEQGITGAGHEVMRDISIASRSSFLAMHSFISHVTSIYRMLCADTMNPTKKATNAGPGRRSFELRELLGVRPDDVPKFEKVRNDLEHYDERIDKWFEEARPHQIIDYSIGSLSHSETMNQEAIIRWLDPDELVLLSRGRKFSLRQIHEQLLTIKDMMGPALMRAWESPFHSTVMNVNGLTDKMAVLSIPVVIPPRAPSEVR